MAYQFTPRLKPHSGQIRILRSKARFRVVKAGRRFGKTKFGIHWLITMAIANDGELVYYVAPTYKMAKEIAWAELFDQLDPAMIKGKNERELWVDLINDARICLKGSENPDWLRGRRLAALLMDEAAFQKPEVYSKVLRPMLADLCAPAMFISSPRPGWFSQLFDAASKCVDGSMQQFHFTIYDNPTIPRAEIENIKATTAEHVWRAEYMAEDVEFAGQVYMEFEPKHIFNPGDEYLGHEKFPGVCAIDWGSDDPTGVTFPHFMPPNGLVIVSDEHVRSGWDSARHSEVIRQKARTRNIETGNYVISFDAFRRTAKDHNSIAEDFRDHLGFTPQRSEKDLDSGVDLMKRLLRGDGESPWLRVSSNCRELISAFGEWNWGEHEPDVLASLRYGVMHAAKRGLLTLAKLNKVRNYQGEAVVDRFTPRLAPKKKSGPARWTLDNDFGVPLYA